MGNTFTLGNQRRLVDAWLEATPMEQRERFIRDHASGLYTMTELCARHTISRKTGYKWLERFDAGGRAALGDRSRAPHRCPHRLADDVAALICAARRQHPSWGRRSCCSGWAAACWRRVARNQHGRRPVGANRLGEAASAPPPAAASWGDSATTAHRMISGRPISRASSERRTAATVTRSRSPTSTRGS